MNDDVVRVELTDIARTELAQRAKLVLPRLIVDAGPVAVGRFLEFFAARIAARIAAHASPKTTKLYDRTGDTITVDEIERIEI